jgi:hypothetical protein
MIKIYLIILLTILNNKIIDNIKLENKRKMITFGINE